MYPTLDKIVEVLNNKKISVITGNNLLEQKYIKGIQALEGVEAGKNIDYGDFIFLSGIGLENIEENLLTILHDVKKKDAVLVLRKGRYIKKIPDRVIQYCDENEIILMEISEDIKLKPIIKSLYAMLFDAEKNSQSMDTMMKKLIDGSYTNTDAEYAYQNGFDSYTYYAAAVIVPDDFFAVKERIGNDSFHELLVKIYNRLVKLMTILGKPVYFSLIENNDIVVFIENEGNFLKKRSMNELFLQLNKVLEDDGRNITISMGISTTFCQLSECRRSVMEAKRSLQILYACKKKKMVRFYEDIGVYRLLFELQDQESFRNIMDGIIGRLKEYDIENHENLTETLRIYLENDKNIGLSANLLYLHRNTLKYRLNKIEEILQCDISDVNTCFNLRLAFKIDCFLQSEHNSYE